MMARLATRALLNSIETMSDSLIQITAERFGKLLFDELVLDPNMHEGIVGSLANEISPDIARREFGFVVIFAIDYHLMRSPAVVELYGEKAQAVLYWFLARNKEWVLKVGLNEADYIDSLELRLSTYNVAFDLWYDGHMLERSGGKRPPEAFLSLALAFCRFCDAHVNNVFTLGMIDNSIISIFTHTAELLKKYEIV